MRDVSLNKWKYMALDLQIFFCVGCNEHYSCSSQLFVTGHKRSVVMLLTILQDITWLKHIEAETKCPPFSKRYLQMHFLIENIWISIMNSLKYVPIGQIMKHPSRHGAGQATSHYLNQFWLKFWRIYASIRLNELKWNKVIAGMWSTNTSNVILWKV